MNLKKKCKVVILPSENKSEIIGNRQYAVTAITGELKLRRNCSDAWINSFWKNKWINYNLYALSDEEIKEHEWCFHKASKSIIQYPNGGFPTKHAMKVIASTDPSLTKGWIRDNDPNRLNPNYVDITTMNGLPQPSPQFVEKYVEEYNKGNVITDVNVDFIFNTTNEDWSKTPVQLEGFYTPKVDKNNFITITKIKDSWTREEVESKCYEAYKAGIQQGIDPSPKPFTKWIEENL